MIITRAIAVFFVVAFVLNAVMCGPFGLDGEVVLIFALAIAAVIGFALAMPLIIWHSANRQFESTMTFPTITSLLCVLGTYLEPGRMFGWALSASFPPAHGGMFGYLIGTAAVAFLTTLVVTFVGGLASKRSWPVVTVFSELSAFIANLPDKPPRALRIASWGGVSVLVFLFIGHGVIGPLIFQTFGPEASFEAGIAWLARTIVFWLPGTTIAGLYVERLGRRRNLKIGHILAILCVLAVLVAALDLVITFNGARHSEHAQWWIEHMSSGKTP